MKRIFLALAGFLTCAATYPRWKGMTQSQRDESLGSIVQKCGLHSESLKLNADGWVVMSFDPAEKYENVSCALAELRRMKVKNMGFIGNEAYLPDKK